MNNAGKPLYQLDVQQVMEAFESNPDGLSVVEAERRLSTLGANIIPEKKSFTLAGLIIDQLKDAMIIILFAAALLAGLLGEWIDAAIIATIVVLNSVMGVFQAYSAEKAIEAIRKMANINARVVRQSQVFTIDASQLVPGDIVLVEAGNVIPADIRLLESFSLMVDESALTGESVNAAKTSLPLLPETLSIADQSNMLFKGTIATKGRANGLVVRTGIHSELGKIASMLSGKKGKTPLQLRMEEFSKKLSFIIIAICTVLFISGWMQGQPPLPMLLIAVSLAVAAIPEALPALVTIALSKGASRLVKQNALIRKLPAVETLGSVNTICTDKTGTLTQNKMQVQEHFIADTAFIQHFYEALALNNDAVLQNNQVVGDPTEMALVEFLRKEIGDQKIQTLQVAKSRIAEIGFTAERKKMTTFHNDGNQTVVYTKGAAEKIFEKMASEQPTALFQEIVAKWTGAGLRVLAMAYRVLDNRDIHISAETSSEDLEKHEENMHVLGLIAMSDPPREEVVEAIQQCRGAGVRVIMITGDHPETAKSIGLQIGLIATENKSVITGTELEKMDQDQVRQAMQQSNIFARVSPAQKLQIVSALQENGQFVAMTGDGVNDAPALKTASIGIAMGISGTDVSKESADMILLDDNFATIVKAIREGRRIFDNIRKFVRYIMTCNSAEILTLSLAPLMGLPIPLLPVHILWINLVTDGLPGVALASESEEPDIMQRPPRDSKESLFAHGITRHIIWVGCLMALVTLFVQKIAIHFEISHWQTMVFTVLSLSQLGHVMAIRSESTFLYKQGITSNKPLFFSVAGTFLLQLMVIYLPQANKLFNTQPLTILELCICIGAASIVFHAVELEKWLIQKRKYKKQT